MTGIISTDVLLDEMDRLLGKEMPTQTALSTVLDKLLDRLQCSVGTIHLLDPASGLLKLRIQRGVPKVVLDRVRPVPIGKGMAGLAAERKQADADAGATVGQFLSFDISPQGLHRVLKSGA